MAFTTLWGPLGPARGRLRPHSWAAQVISTLTRLTFLMKNEGHQNFSALLNLLDCSGHDFVQLGVTSLENTHTVNAMPFST